MSLQKYICLLCCKSFENGVKTLDSNSHQIQNLIETKVVKKIHKLFISIGCHSHSDRLLEALDFSDFKVLEGDGEHLPITGICSDCEIVATAICDLHHEIICLELRLDWRIETLQGIMKLGGRIPSRLQHLRSHCDEMDKCIKRGKNISFTKIDSVRGKLMAACSTRRSKVFPRIILRKYLNRDKTEDGQRKSSQSVESSLHVGKKLRNHDDECMEKESTEMEQNCGLRKLHRIITCKHCPKTFSSSRSLEFHSKQCIGESGGNEVPEWEDDDKEGDIEDYLDTFSPVESTNEQAEEENFELHGLSYGKDRSKQSGSSPQDSRGLTVDSELATEDEPLPCEVAGCKEKFSLPRELENHSKMHGQFSCSKCSVVMTFAPDLAQHEADEHAETEDASAKFQCPRCTFTLNCSLQKGKTTFMKHFLPTHLNLDWATLICAICGMQYIPANLNQRKRFQSRHFKRAHDISNLDTVEVQKCDQCPAYFKKMSALRLHKKIVHLVTKAKFKCGECGKEFRKRSKRRQHLLKVHKMKFSFACSVPDCKQRFPDQDDLSIHIEAVHRTETLDGVLKTYKCRKCDHISKGRLEHLKHIGGHNKKKEKPSFVCEQCGKVFKRKENLNVHSLSHSGPDSWQFCCEICGRKFISKQRLIEHGRTHTKDKPFQCSVCGEKYSHRHNLKNHVNKKHGDVMQDISKSNPTSRKRKRKMPQ